jgi:predicted TIM-barrel fold metal-dependent hydrolase
MVKKSLLVLLVISVVGFGFLAVRDFRLYPQSLSVYLQDLFVRNEITLNEDDFFEPTDDPYLAFAKILNLIPSSAQGDDRITQKKAREISRQFLAVKDKLYLDGLYGKIDMHEHYWVSGDIDLFLKAAGCLGISKVVLLPTGLAPDNKFYKLNWLFLIQKAKKYPDQVIPFCTIDEADPHAAELVEQYILEGAKGIKLIGGHPDYYDEPLNSENMYKVYQKAAEYGMPVLLHGSIINIDGLKDQLDQVYSDFPEVTFIHAHYGSTILSMIYLNQIAELLDKHPNLYIDLSMGSGIAAYQYHLKQDLEKIRDFVIKYQDRILFGSDIILCLVTNDLDLLYERIRCDIDINEKAEYTCEFGSEFGMSDCVHQGLNLDKEILRKLYYENPKKVLGL